MSEVNDTSSNKVEKLVSLTADITAAYVANNSLAIDEIPTLMQNVHKTLSEISDEKIMQANKLIPAVSISKSVTSDFIICLEDGKQFKSLKRHLRTHYDLSPEEYREKWGLPVDYPMVAPNYAAARSKLAKNMGLGQKNKKEALKLAE